MNYSLPLSLPTSSVDTIVQTTSRVVTPTGSKNTLNRPKFCVLADSTGTTLQRLHNALHHGL